MELDEPSQEHASAETILEAARSARALTQRILAFSRKRSGALVPVDLHAIIPSTLALLDTKGREVEVRTDMSAPRSRVLGDAQGLQSTLLNLAINGLDAMTEGGQLTVSTAMADDQVMFVRLSVSDTGHGMDRETRERLFEPFYTTKTGGRGTGLGLFSVMRCVREHRGTIEVDSSPGQGTTLSILLPLAPAEAESGEGDVAESQRRTGRVMVVDDEAVVRDLTTRMLEDFGHQVDAFAEGGAAVEHYRAHHRSIDLVLLDVRMPALDGPAVAELLRATNPEVGIVFVTAFPDDLDRDPRLAEQNVTILQKPFDLRHICTVVAREITAGAQDP